MNEILTGAAIMAGLGLLFGTILALSYRFLKVQEDPRIDEVEEMLPGSNCGACGEPGCRALAEKVVGGAVAPAKCTVSSKDKIEMIAEYLGVEAGEGRQAGGPPPLRRRPRPGVAGGLLRGHVELPCRPPGRRRRARVLVGLPGALRLRRRLHLRRHGDERPAAARGRRRQVHRLRRLRRRLPARSLRPDADHPQAGRAVRRAARGRGGAADLPGGVRRLRPLRRRRGAGPDPHGEQPAGGRLRRRRRAGRAVGHLALPDRGDPLGGRRAVPGAPRSGARRRTGSGPDSEHGERMYA